jgi:hypothetical protein
MMKLDKYVIIFMVGKVNFIISLMMGNTLTMKQIQTV